jgi:phosphoenolpyruvate carboxykinase (GTP)
MAENKIDFLESKMAAEQLEKLKQLGQSDIIDFVAETVTLCKPDSVFVATDSTEDIAHVREMSVANGEEHTLAMEGHTYHFDGIKDQGRDPANTKYLLPPDMHLGERINFTTRDEGLSEITGILDGSMAGKEMVVRFFCLGPRSSVFSQLCCQITDSYYVAHSEDLLYRCGYEEFGKAGDHCEHFRFLHSAGKLENGVCADVDKRRIYIDLAENTVYSANTQYGGNTMGLKKLAMRLGISKGLREGWLTEHMFIIGVPGPGGRRTYLTGAFPSMCGKTSTAMIGGQTIVGDDIAYLKKIDGQVRTVNVESGIFGIIQDVNPDDDPDIYDAIVTPREIIFSNILIVDDKPYWLGMGRELPEKGLNYSGDWQKGKVDDGGKPIDPAHKNARFTIRISELENCDEHLDDPEGVPVAGMIFGGRDSDTSVPVEQSFDWTHGVITKGASLESETTAATIGTQGVRTFNPMSNLEFLAASLDTYINKYLEFSNELEKVPAIFSVNYFLRGEDGNYLNGMLDKKVWMLWIEERVNGETDALMTPTGFIPLYKDLRRLFASALDLEYTEEQYKAQFTIRVPEQLAKIERIEKVYSEEWGIPEILFDTLAAQKDRLESARLMYGDYISPLLLAQG